MDNAILKKRLSTFRSVKGSLARISNDVVMDVHKAWESWEGNTVVFAREIGITSAQLGVIIKKGKRLIKEGVVTESEFKQIQAPSASSEDSLDCGKGAIVMKWEKGKLIRFSAVDQLVDFLKKVA
jgi:hypothetical protein